MKEHEKRIVAPLRVLIIVHRPTVSAFAALARAILFPRSPPSSLLADAHYRVFRYSASSFRWVCARFVALAPSFVKGVCRLLVSPPCLCLSSVVPPCQRNLLSSWGCADSNRTRRQSSKVQRPYALIHCLRITSPRGFLPPTEHPQFENTAAFTRGRVENYYV